MFKKITALLSLLAIANVADASVAKQTMHTETAVIVPGGYVLPYTIEGKWKVFHLVAEPVKQIIYNAKVNTLAPYEKKANRYVGAEANLPEKTEVLKGWGYNGHIPGPAIVVHKGDHVRVIVDNKLPEPTTIHWHGLIVPNNQDGTGGTTEPVIQPGKQTVYQFDIKQVGTFMYHSGFNDTKQIQKGMGGFFISLPKGKSPLQKDFAIMLQMFTLPQSGGKPTVFSMDPDWFTFNGLVAPNIPVLDVNEGDHVLVRFGNLANSSHPIHLHGYTFKIVGTEGGEIPESAQIPAATVNVAPGQTRDIAFTADNPGLWRFHCHKVLHIVNDNAYWKKQAELKILPIGGMFTYLYVAPKNADSKKP